MGRRAGCVSAWARPVEAVAARAVGAGVAAALAVILAPVAAFAAGSPYGGPPVLPGHLPGGYRRVIAAVTVSDRGRVLAGKYQGTRLRVVVPRGAAPHGEQLVLTSARARSISGRDLARVPRAVRHDHAVYALAVLLQRDQRPVTDRRLVTLELTGRQFSRSEYVVVWSPRLRRFVPAPRGHARVVDRHLVVRMRASTEIAVLAP